MQGLKGIFQQNHGNKIEAVSCAELIMEFNAIKRELKEELNKLTLAESKIDVSLSQYFGLPSAEAPTSGMSFESRDLSNGLVKIESAAPMFEAMLQDSKKLALQVEEGGSLSDRLSSIVRRLDVIQIRAQQALACTEDIMNMKDYKIKLCSAIENDDLVQAVAYIRQVQEIDVKAASASDDYHFIMEKKKEVRELVRKRFNGALERSDDIKIVMSLCPLLNTLELENEARDDFIKYVEKSLLIKISGSDDKAAKGTADEATGYANTLLDIFNTAFLIIQQNLPMIIQGMENSHGDVYFIRRLHARCEDQAGSVLKRYMKFRRMRELIEFTNGQVTTPTAAAHHWTVAEVHSIMDELALHIQYCTRYLKYLRHICKGAETKKRKAVTSTATTANNSEDSTSSSVAVPSANLGVEKVFPGPTPFDKMKDELVNKYYLEGEKWLMRQGVRNILPDNIEEGIGMRLDESFFVLQKCSLRAIATNDIHSACSIIHFISELISTDLLVQATQLLVNSSSKVGTIMQDHMTQFKRITLDKSSLPEASFNKSSSHTISSGFKTALLSIGSTAAATREEANKDNSIQLHEDGGFYIASSGHDLSDPWGVSNLLEAFSLMELCSRYTDRLGSDIWKAGQGVFGDEDETGSESLGAGGKSGKTGGSSSGASKALAGLSSIERLKQCKDEIDSLKLSFSKVLLLLSLVCLRFLTSFCILESKAGG